MVKRKVGIFEKGHWKNVNREPLMVRKLRLRKGAEEALVDILDEEKIFDEIYGWLYDLGNRLVLKNHGVHWTPTSRD